LITREKEAKGRLDLERHRGGAKVDKKNVVTASGPKGGKGANPNRELEGASGGKGKTQLPEIER